MRIPERIWLFLFLFLAGAFFPAGQASINVSAAKPLKAGLARIVITPDKPVWMAGYAARTKPSEGKLQELEAKALALEDASGNRFVLVTTDLLGIPGALSSEIAEHANKSHGLRRDQILFNSSHTHSGPVLSGSLVGAYELDSAQNARVNEYTQELKTKLIRLIGEALRDLSPAKISYGRGAAPFAMNRRQFRNGQMVIGTNPEGVVDREVPVLRIEGANGTLRGIAFGYACHNTTLTGEFYQLSGDYAGFAQQEIERAHPGATALFVMGCGADINPNPRSRLELAQQHGESLARGVEAALKTQMIPIEGKVKSTLGTVMIPYAPVPTREEFQARLSDQNIYKRQHAKRMLARYEKDGKLPAEYAYTAQAVQIGPLTVFGLAGEVVTDYDLRLKREFGDLVWVAGYSNDLCSYIPSKRMYAEGGYEVVDSMMFYDMPGPYTPEIEEKIIGKVHELARRVGRAPQKGK